MNRQQFGTQLGMSPPATATPGAIGLPPHVDAAGGPTGHADRRPPARPQTAGPPRRASAGVNLPRDAGPGDVGRACRTLVRRHVGRQFVGRSPRAVAVEDRGPDAPPVAAARDAWQPEAFWRGWRVVAPRRHEIQRDEYAADRGDHDQGPHAARAGRVRKLTTSVFLEVGCRIRSRRASAAAGESEWALARHCWRSCRAGLFLGDRLYGVAAFVGPRPGRVCTVGSHFLLRAGRATSRADPRLPDGSRLIRIALRARHGRGGYSSGSRCARFACA